MRRAVGSKREVVPGVWRLEVSAGYDPVTGKRNRPSSTIRGDEAAADRELARLMLGVGLVPTTKLTLSEYVNEVWLPAISVRKRTYDEYEAKMRLHVLPVLGKVRMDRLEPYLIDRWVLGLPKTRTGLHAFRVLHTALTRAVRWRIIEHHPLDSVEAPPDGEYEPDVLAVDEANDYLDAFAGHELEPFVVLAIGAGLRRSELMALEWSDVDLKAATVHITKGRHERKGEVWNEDPKSRTSRRLVSLPPWAVEALKPHRGIGPITTLKPSQVSYRYGKRLRQVDAERRAKDKDDGLRYVPMKQLRHSHATIALAAGVDLVTVSRRLGHSTATITDAFYLRPGRAADQRAAEAIDGMRHRAPRYLLAPKCGNE